MMQLVSMMSSRTLNLLLLGVLMMVGCKSKQGVKDASTTTTDLQGVSCADAGPNDWHVTSVGEAGAIEPTADGGVQANLMAIWGSSEREIFAVGNEGVVLFYNGESWTRIESPKTVTLTSVWGTSATDVWVAGFDGTVMQYNGTSWTDRSPPETAFLATDAGIPAIDGGASDSIRKNLWGIWVQGTAAQGAQHVYAVGDDGMIVYYNKQNNSWRHVDSGVQEKLSGVWGANPTTVFIVGDFGVALKGGATAGFNKCEHSVSRALHGVWGRGPNDVYAVGLNGTVMHHDGDACTCTDCETWKEIEGAPKQYLRAIWGPPSSNLQYIAGWDGTILKMERQGGTAQFEVYNCVTLHRLEGIWGTMVDAPTNITDAGPSDAATTDAGAPQKIPAVWVSGVSGTIVTGP